MTENTINKRQTAYAFWVADIKSAQIDSSQQYPSFSIRDKNTVRINLIAIITAKYISDNGSYAALEVDDGTGIIQVKSWNEDTILINKHEIGNIVLIIGKLGLNNSKDVYVRPEIIRQVEVPWLLSRKKELGQKYGAPNIIEQPVKAAEMEEIIHVVEEIVPAVSKSAVRAKVLEVLNGNSDGLDENRIAEMSSYGKNDVLKAINELVREGEIYYARPGILKGL